MKNIKNISLSALALLALVACNKEPEVSYDVPPAVQDAGKVTLEFKNYFNDQPLQLETEYTSNGQTVKFSEVKYIISNITMEKEDETDVVYNWAKLDKGALLIDQAGNEASKTIELDTIAAARYKSIKFGLGVKRDHDTLSITRGLSPRFVEQARQKEMLWTWSDHFLFAKFKGTYGTNNPLEILIGNGKRNSKLHTDWDAKEDVSDNRDAFRYVTIDFTTPVTLTKDGHLKIVIKADLNKLLDGENKQTLTAKIPQAQNNLDKMFPIVNNIGGRQGTTSGKVVTVSKVKNETTDPDEDLEGISNTIPANRTGMFSVLSVE